MRNSNYARVNLNFSETNAFSTVPNDLYVSGLRSSVDKPFHDVGPLTTKLRSPSVRPCSRNQEFVGPLQTLDGNTRCVMTPAKPSQQGTYDGARLWWQLWVRTPTLNDIRSFTRSQWSSRRDGVMWSNRRAPVTSRAAAFWTRWSCFSNWPLMPDKMLLQ